MTIVSVKPLSISININDTANDIIQYIGLTNMITNIDNIVNNTIISANIYGVHTLNIAISHHVLLKRRDESLIASLGHFHSMIIIGKAK